MLYLSPINNFSFLNSLTMLKSIYYNKKYERRAAEGGIQDKEKRKIGMFGNLPKPFLT